MRRARAPLSKQNDYFILYSQSRQTSKHTARWQATFPHHPWLPAGKKCVKWRRQGGPGWPMSLLLYLITLPYPTLPQPPKKPSFWPPLPLQQSHNYNSPTSSLAVGFPAVCELCRSEGLPSLEGKSVCGAMMWGNSAWREQSVRCLFQSSVDCYSRLLWNPLDVLRMPQTFDFWEEKRRYGTVKVVTVNFSVIKEHQSLNCRAIYLYPPCLCPWNNHIYTGM